LSCATIAYAPARQAALPDLVTGDELPAANTSFQAVNYVVDLFALPLAGLVVAVLIQQHGVERGTFMVFGLDAISYVASAALLRRLPRQQTPAGQRHRPPHELLSQVAEGLRFLARDPHLRTNTLLLTLGPLMLGSLHTLWIGFAWRVSHTETLGYGIVEAANAIGTLVGLYVLRHVGARLNPGRTILLGFAVMGSAIASVGWSDSLAVVACLAALGGLGNMLFLVPSITLVQRRTPSELRGRVFAVRMMLTFAAFSMSNALAGGLADSIGVGPLFVVLGSGMLLLAAIGGLFASARDAS